MLSTGISYPDGKVTVTSGGTSTETITYTVYTAALSGTNSFPPLWGISYLLIIIGVIGLIYVFLEIYRSIFTPNEKPIKWY